MGTARPPVIVALLACAVALWGAGAAPALAADREARLPVSRPGGRPLSMPYDVAVDRSGVVFLLESGSRAISIFSPKGEFVREISGRGAWKDPSAIAPGPDGTVFLADGSSGRVLQLDLSGKVRREYSAGGGARLTGVGFHAGAVFCADNRNHRIVVFRKPGAAPESWGKRGDRPGEFHAPFRIAVDPSGRVFVTDVMNARVQWFSAFGRHLGTLKRFGAAEGRIFRPAGIALDPRGKVWVGDSYTGLVQLFELNGEYARGLAAGGRPLVFGDPVGLAVGPTGIWVADQRRNRLELHRD